MGGVYTAGKKRSSVLYLGALYDYVHTEFGYFREVTIIFYNQIHTCTFSGLTTTFSVKGTAGQVCQASVTLCCTHACLVSVCFTKDLTPT